MDEWRYIYREERNSTTPLLPKPVAKKPIKTGANPEDGLIFRKDGKVEDTVQLGDPLPLSRDPAAVAASPCDENHPRLFHMFWTGPFTDKPYMLLMSFLYTQNLQLDQKDPDPTVCRPQFWLWIKMKSAVAESSPNGLREMYESLGKNPWSAPFLHKRFKDVIKFKLWDTTEQLDGIPEIRNDWREFKDVLFNAGGHI
jgi:WD repeat and SOF domain-containing protein 1